MTEDGIDEVAAADGDAATDKQPPARLSAPAAAQTNVAASSGRLEHAHAGMSIGAAAVSLPPVCSQILTRVQVSGSAASRTHAVS